MSSGISSALELSLEAIGPYLTKQNGEKVVQIIAASCLLGLIYFISLGIYNLYFHPLSSYPGPRLWCAYRFPYWYHTFQGNFPFAVAKHHDAYGPVVRIGPNELSFINEEAWNDIYGFRPGKRQLAKDPWKALPAPDTGVHGIITTPSDADHGRMRRSLTHGFSEKALRDQEALMVVYFDSLISKLKEVAASKKETDMLLWFNFTTFDIIGDLTFGYNFDSLNTGRDWITAISLFVKEQVITDIPRAYPLISWFLKRYVPKELMDVKMAHINNSAGKLDERMASNVVRPDFMSSVLKTYGTEIGFTYEELRPTASLLMLAGSETTATTLSAALYFLSTNPVHLKSLTSEIRSTFDTDASITILAVGQMKSLLAVLDETMRMLPPVPSGEFSRVTGKDGDVIAGNFVPPNTSVSVKQWAANHSASNFRDPDLFDPERWLGNEEKYRDDKRKVVQPFLVGPRACLGRNLAYAEMRVILARVLWNFDFEISDQSLNWMERMKAWNLWEKDPLMMKLKIRE